MTNDAFVFGPTVDISQLTEEQAIAVFGRPVYEAWRHSLAHQSQRGQYRVTEVNRAAGTITLKWEPGE